MQCAQRPTQNPQARELQVIASPVKCPGATCEPCGVTPMPSRSDTRTHSTRGMGGAWHFHFLTVRRPSYKLVPVESATPLVACLGPSPPSPSPFRYGRFSTISQRFASGESQLGLWGLLIVGDSTDIDTPRWYAGPNTRRWRN